MCGCYTDTQEVCAHHARQIREQYQEIDRLSGGSRGFFWNAAIESLRNEYGSRRVDVALAEVDAR